MAEVRLSAPVRAMLVDDLFPDGAVPAGAYKFWVYGGETDDSPPAGLNFRCPCGCDGMWGIRFRHEDGRMGWSWDGNREAPTASPSVLAYAEDGTAHWHGWLRGGYWTQA